MAGVVSCSANVPSQVLFSTACEDSSGASGSSGGYTGGCVDSSSASLVLPFSSVGSNVSELWPSPLVLGVSSVPDLGNAHAAVAVTITCIVAATSASGTIWVDKGLIMGCYRLIRP